MPTCNKYYRRCKPKCKKYYCYSSNSSSSCDDYCGGFCNGLYPWGFGFPWYPSGLFNPLNVFGNVGTNPFPAQGNTGTTGAQLPPYYGGFLNPSFMPPQQLFNPYSFPQFSYPYFFPYGCFDDCCKRKRCCYDSSSSSSSNSCSSSSSCGPLLCKVKRKGCGKKLVCKKVYRNDYYNNGHGNGNGSRCDQCQKKKEVIL